MASAPNVYCILSILFCNDVFPACGMLLIVHYIIRQDVFPAHLGCTAVIMNGPSVAGNDVIHGDKVSDNCGRCILRPERNFAVFMENIVGKSSRQAPVVWETFVDTLRTTSLVVGSVFTNERLPGCKKFSRFKRAIFLQPGSRSNVTAMLLVCRSQFRSFWMILQVCQ